MEALVVVHTGMTYLDPEEISQESIMQHQQLFVKIAAINVPFLLT